jgi:hypothetical protein
MPLNNTWRHEMAFSKIETKSLIVRNLATIFGYLSGAVTFIEKDSDGLVSRCKCATGSIPSAVAGYAVGCVLTDTTTGHVYVNTGSASSCTFNDVGAISAGEIALATGSILVGTAGVGAAVDAKASGNVLVGNATTLVSDTPDNAGLVAKTGNQAVAGIKTFSSPPIMSGASITAATIPASSLVNGAGIAVMVTAGLGNSGSYVKTDTGTKTLVAANATKDRGVLVVVTITETFATGDTSQLILKIGETNTIEKCAASAVFTNAAAGSVFCFGFINTSTKAIIATLTASAGTGTGAFSYVVLALPNS